MENTESNLQKRSTSLIIEMGGSIVLLFCLFLPWVVVQVGGNSTFGMSLGTSYSAFDAISMLNKGGSMVARFTSSTNYWAILYFVPILCIVNPIVQYFRRLPWLSFYTAWIPVLATIVLVYGMYKEGGDGGFGGIGMGAGAILSLIVGLLMQFSAWTKIGMHNREYRNYFFMAILWALFGWGIVIVILSNSSLWREHMEGCTAWFTFGSIGISHTIYLIYGGFVAIISPADTPVSSTIQQTNDSSVENINEYLDKARTRSDEELKTIIRQKDDYNERLVRAAKQVLIERIANSDISAKLPDATIPVAVTDDDKFKAYQPKPLSSTPEEKQEYSPEKTRSDSFEVVKNDWKPESRGCSQPKDVFSPEVAKTEEGTTSTFTSQKTNNTVFLSILAGVILAVGGALIYFLWYMPYAEDKDAARMYVVADNVLFRSSGTADTESNIINTVPYGSQALTYDVVGDWAEVKIDGRKGVVAAGYLLSTEDFDLLNGAWGNSNVKDCIESTKCRLAILDFYKTSGMGSGDDGWQIYTKAKDMKPNSVYYPKLYDKNSKFTDFMFLVKNNRTGARQLVCYSFEDETEKPIFRFNIDAPEDGYIKKLNPYKGGVVVLFDNWEQLNIEL